MKSKLMICPKAGECNRGMIRCPAASPHENNTTCTKGFCGVIDEYVACIPYRPKRKPKTVKVKASLWYTETSKGKFKSELSIPCRIELTKSDYDKLRRKK